MVGVTVVMSLFLERIKGPCRMFMRNFLSRKIFNDSSNFPRKISKIYEARFASYGANIKASLWFDLKKNKVRNKILFDQIKRMTIAQPVIADVGCGYGDFPALLISNGIIFKSYIGYDICKSLIRSCKLRYPAKNIAFYYSQSPIRDATFTVMSGTHNLAVTKSVNRWEAYLIESIKTFLERSTRALLINLQTTVDETYISEKNIYHVVATDFLSLCWEKLGVSAHEIKHEDYSESTFVIQK